MSTADLASRIRATADNLYDCLSRQDFMCLKEAADALIDAAKHAERKDALVHQFQINMDLSQRAEAAESRVERYKVALEKIVATDGNPAYMHVNLAREALKAAGLGDG